MNSRGRRSLLSPLLTLEVAVKSPHAAADIPSHNSGDLLKTFARLRDWRGLRRRGFFWGGGVVRPSVRPPNDCTSVCKGGARDISGKRYQSY